MANYVSFFLLNMIFFHEFLFLHTITMTDEQFIIQFVLQWCECICDIFTGVATNIQTARR